MMGSESAPGADRGEPRSSPGRARNSVDRSCRVGVLGLALLLVPIVSGVETSSDDLSSTSGAHFARSSVEHLEAEGRVGAAYSFANLESDDASQGAAERLGRRLSMQPLVRVRGLPNISESNAAIDDAPSARGSGLTPWIVIQVTDLGAHVSYVEQDVVVGQDAVRDGTQRRRNIASSTLVQHRNWLMERLASDAKRVGTDTFERRLLARRRQLTERQLEAARSVGRLTPVWDEVVRFRNEPRKGKRVERLTQYRIQLDLRHFDGTAERRWITVDQNEVDRVAAGSVSAGRPADLLDWKPFDEVVALLRRRVYQETDATIDSIRRAEGRVIARQVARLGESGAKLEALDLGTRLLLERPSFDPPTVEWVRAELDRLR